MTIAIITAAAVALAEAPRCNARHAEWRHLTFNSHPEGTEDVVRTIEATKL